MNRHIVSLCAMQFVLLLCISLSTEAQVPQVIDITAAVRDMERELRSDVAKAGLESAVSQIYISIGVETEGIRKWVRICARPDSLQTNLLSNTPQL